MPAAVIGDISCSDNINNLAEKVVEIKLEADSELPGDLCLVQ